RHAVRQSPEVDRPQQRRPDRDGSAAPLSRVRAERVSARPGCVVDHRGARLPADIVFQSLTPRGFCMLQRTAFYLIFCATATAGAQDRAMPPESERQLARSILQEMVEIKSGYSTGTTTPVAEAAARRLRAAGFPDSDIFVGG